MIRIRGPDEARSISDPDIRRLVEERFDQVLNGHEYDPEIHGEMIVVEPGDMVLFHTGCGLGRRHFLLDRPARPDQRGLHADGRGGPGCRRRHGAVEHRERDLRYH